MMQQRASLNLLVYYNIAFLKNQVVNYNLSAIFEMKNDYVKYKATLIRSFKQKKNRQTIFLFHTAYRFLFLLDKILAAGSKRIKEHAFFEADTAVGDIGSFVEGVACFDDAYLAVNVELKCT